MFCCSESFSYTVICTVVSRTALISTCDVSGVLVVGDAVAGDWLGVPIGVSVVELLSAGIPEQPAKTIITNSDVRKIGAVGFMPTCMKWVIVIKCKYI